MSTIDRSKAPAFRKVDHVHLLHTQDITLSNDMPVYYLNAGTQEVVKVEFLFNAGMKYGRIPMVATAVNDMLDEGTKNRTAIQLAEELDFYGAFIESEVTHDHASFTLYTLNKFLDETLDIVKDILFNASFPEKEFGIYIANKKQKYIVDSDKVNVLARRRFGQLLFGDEHPYGAITRLEHFDQLSHSELKKFHEEFYHAGNGCIIVSGCIPDLITDKLNSRFGVSEWRKGKSAELKLSAGESHKERAHLVKKEGAIQSALRVGRLLFNREHPDFPGMQVLNCVLGGYFGSRLMANIREDKGYTYGIGSGLVSLLDSGYFYISAEVGVDVTGAALKEVYYEIDRLRNELIPEEELELVRNYLTGVFLRTTDGPFALADRRRALIGYNLDYTYYDRYLKTIQTISAEQLKALAVKYLSKEDLLELVAGDKK